ALPLGNGASGIYLGASNNVLVDNNVIAFNHDVGVGSAISAQSIGVQRDALFANGTLGIDYGLDGVTPNDSSNRPTDPPQFPLIPSAVWDGSAGVTRIEGIAPPSRYVSDRGSVDLYRNGGEEWLGAVILEYSSQPRPFTLAIPRNLRGNSVSATFTRLIL